MRKAALFKGAVFLFQLFFWYWREGACYNRCKLEKDEDFNELQ